MKALTVLAVLTIAALAACTSNNSSEERRYYEKSEYRTNAPADTMPAGEARKSNYADNATCPVMGGSISDKVPTVEWRGHRVGFCCTSCVAKWNAMSESEKDAAWAKAMHS